MRRTVSVLAATAIWVGCSSGPMVSSDDGGVDAAAAPDVGSDAYVCSDAWTSIDAFVPVDAAPIDPLCEGSVCGGDVTGTWQIMAGCAGGTGNASFLSCAEGTLTYLEWSATGTFTFAADGTLSTNAAEHFRGQAFLPLSCYHATTCPQLTLLAARSMIDARCMPDPSSSGCAPIDCDCAIAIDRSAVMLMGTYTADPVAGHLTAMIGTETIDGEYCVNGNELWLHALRFGSVEYHYRFQRVP